MHCIYAKFVSQVCSVLDSLEREYKREDVDWYARTTAALNTSDGDKSSDGDQIPQDRVVLIGQLIAKHQEQKEAFLKACTLARRTAETFLKYSNRSLQYFSHPASQSTFRGPDGKVKGNTLFIHNTVNTFDQLLYSICLALYVFFFNEFCSDIRKAVNTRESGA